MIINGSQENTLKWKEEKFFIVFARRVRRRRGSRWPRWTGGWRSRRWPERSSRWPRSPPRARREQRSPKNNNCYLVNSLIVHWETKKTKQSLFIFYIYKRLRPKKKSATERRKSRKNFLLMKLNTKPLKFKCGLANRGGGPGWQTRARHGYPHLVYLYKRQCLRQQKNGNNKSNFLGGNFLERIF